MKKAMKIFSILLVFGILLTACSLPSMNTVSENDIQTAVAKTVQAAVTQVAPTVIQPEPTKPEVLPPTLAPTQTPYVITATPVVVVPTVVAPTVVVVQPTSIPVPCNRAAFVADISIPDNTVLSPNQGFTKTWRLQNNGSCTWGSGYVLAFHSGDSMGGPVSVPLPASVAPGHTVDLTVNLQAPAANGTYTGVWMLKNPQGGFFGLGNQAEKAFWVKVVVGTPSTTPGATAVPGVTQPSGSCRILSAVPSYNATFNPRDQFDNKWTVKNTSGKTWSSGDVDIKYSSGTKWMKYDTTAYDLPSDVGVNGEYTFILDAVAPENKGTYTMNWVITGGGVNCVLSSTITVK